MNDLGPTKPAFRNLLWKTGTLALLIGLSLFLQWQSGAWRSDFGGHSDEASHVVTSLMFRDYLAGGFVDQWHPIRYAEGYYEQFPKVAIGHYPPGFYLVGGFMLLPVREPGAMLVLMVLLSALAGWLTGLLGRRTGLNGFESTLVAVLFCLLPLVRTYTSIVMSDLLVVVFCLAAVVTLTRFFEKPTFLASILFGLWAALAILTKGSGILLAGVPVLAIVFSGRWRLLRNPRLWVAPVPVLLLALPWMFLTHKITAEGMQSDSTLSFLDRSIGFYLRGMTIEFGWIGSACLVAAGLVAIASAAMGRKDQIGGDCSEGESAAGHPSAALVVLACVLSGFLLVSLVPAGLDRRYLLPIAPGVLVLAAWLMKGLLARRWPRIGLWGVPLLSLLILAETWRPVTKRFTGAGTSIESVKSHPSVTSSRKEPRRILVISSANGEGALTAAAAFMGKDSLQILRGTKVLSTSDWMGRGYQLTFNNREELGDLLRREKVDYTIIDFDPASKASVFKHWELALDYLSSDGEDLNLTPLATRRSVRKHGRETQFRIFVTNK